MAKTVALNSLHSLGCYQRRPVSCHPGVCVLESQDFQQNEDLFVFPDGRRPTVSLVHCFFLNLSLILIG